MSVTRPTADCVVLQVGGEIDMLSSGTLDVALGKELEATPGDLMIDLAEVTFLASSGLAVLIRAAGEAEERGIRLTLIAQHRAVLRPLQVTRTSDRFHIEPTLGAATRPPSPPRRSRAATSEHDPQADPARRSLEIRITASPKLIPTVRVAASDLAARADFDLDAISDLRMAVDEACATLVGIATAESVLTCRFTLLADRIDVEVTVPAHPARRPPMCRRTLSAGECCRPWRTRSGWCSAPLTTAPNSSESGSANGPARMPGDPSTTRSTAGWSHSSRSSPRWTPDDPRREALRDKIVTGFLPVAEHIARRFAHRGEPLDDLVQVATIGLINAVDRFEPERGSDFFSFAVPTISGEVRRHFRDQGWSMRVPRRLKDMHVAINRVVSELSQQLGRAPKPSEIAQRLDLPIDEVLEGLEAAQAYRSSSLDELLSSEEGSATVGELVGGGRRRAGERRLPPGATPAARRAAAARAHHRHAPVLRQPDPDADRRAGRHLADARLPAARPDPGAVAEPPRRGRLRTWLLRSGFGTAWWW